MIETGNLSEFNEIRKRDISSCNDAEIVAILSEKKNSFPNIYSLLTETTKFYTENFSDLQKYIKREKRLVVFETPSRVSMTHEYTIEGAGNISQGFYFLFNTRERLSWLKIFLEEKRVSIASRAKVVSLLMKKLDTELGNFAAVLHISPIDAAMRLYEASDGKPCFIEFNNKEYKGQQSLLLSITFFDSIRNKVSHYRKRCLSPLREKQIKYNYSIISGDANAWVYFKSPTNFVLSISHSAEEGEFEASPSNDDEIKSLVLTPKGERLSVDFIISIDVPTALKRWYKAMLYLACIGVLCGAVLCGLIMYTSIPEKIIETFNNCSYAIIAALIATRGWLMSEEQVMKNISNLYTYIICILTVLIMTLSFVPHTRSENTSKSQNTILDNKNNEHSIAPDSVAYNTHNNKKSNIDDTLNNTRKIKLKVYDLPQMITPNESKSLMPTKKKADVCDKINSSQDTISKKALPLHQSRNSTLRDTAEWCRN